MSGEGKPLVGCSQKRAPWWELGQAPVVIWVLLRGQIQLFWRQVVALALWGPQLQAPGPTPPGWLRVQVAPPGRSSELEQ